MFIAAVLHTVLIASDEAPANAAVVRVLSRIVEKMGIAVEAFDHSRTDRRLLTQPDRCAHHENVSGHHLLVNLGPVVAIPSVFRHVGIHTRPRSRSRRRGRRRR